MGFSAPGHTCTMPLLHSVPALDVELQAVDGCLGRENQFAPWMQHLIGYPVQGVRINTCYVRSTR